MTYLGLEVQTSQNKYWFKSQVSLLLEEFTQNSALNLPFLIILTLIIDTLVHKEYIPI